MRGNKRDQLKHEERETLEQERSAESRVRREKRKAKGKADDIAKALQRSPAGKKAAAALKTKRGVAREKEQANYQRNKTRASARIGGRSKQVRSELHNRPQG
jgi:hypothetical protein